MELAQVPLRALGDLGAVAPGANRQHATVDIDVDILLAEAGQERLDLQFIGGAVDIERERGTGLRRAAVGRARADEAALQELAHRVAQAEHVVEGVPDTLSRHRATS